MKNIKQFENFENDLDVHYELYTVDMNGDDFYVNLEDDDYDYNPNDLIDSVKLMEKYEKKYKGSRKFFLKKITEEVVDDKTIEEAKLRIKAKKYNI